MKILVLSCSPKRETSLTLHNLKFIEKMFPDDTFSVHYTTNGTFSDDLKEEFSQRDLVLMISSIFHFSVHSAMLPLLIDMKKKMGDEIVGKPFTYLTTSGKNGEYNAHDLVRRFAQNNGMKWITSLSLDDVSALSPEGREEMFCWFGFVKETVENEGKPAKLKDKAGVVILDTFETETERSKAINDRLLKYYENAGADVKVLALRDYKINPCSACCSCYTTRKCVIQDDFESLTDATQLGIDIIVYTGTPAYGTYGPMFKRFTERHMQYGRAGEITGVISAFVCDVNDLPAPDDMAYFEKHQSCVESLAHGFLTGFYAVKEADEKLDYIAELTVHAYNKDAYPQNSGLAVGLDMQFAKLSERIRALQPADYEDYRKRGFYEPTKIEEKARACYNAEDAAKSRKGRTIPFNMMLIDFNGKVKVTERRPLKSDPFTARRQREANEVIEGNKKPEKRGLFGMKKK